MSDAAQPMKVDSLERYLESVRSSGNTVRPVLIPVSTSLPHDLPADQINAFQSLDANEVNFWWHREMAAVSERAPWQHALNNMLVANCRADMLNHYWWHFLRASNSKEDMVSYVPSHQYGLADRRIRLSVGRYLSKFYSDYLTPAQIRDVVNLSQQDKVLFATGRAEIRRVYEEGPRSCMKDAVHGTTHSCEVYGYQYPSGDYEFAVAYLERDNQITARALVAMKPKVFVRHYGDDGPVLASKLKSMGYVQKSSMGHYALRLLEIDNPCGSGYLMPYLDGDDDFIEHMDGYWVWNESRGLSACNADGVIDGEDRELCAWCDNSELAEDMYTVLDQNNNEMLVCDSCCNNHFIDAVSNRYGHNAYVHEDAVVENQSNGSYYATWVLDSFNIVEDRNGEYWFIDDVTWLEYRNEYACPNDDVVQLHDGDWALLDDTVRLYDDDYALAEDAVELADGDYALAGDAVELANGTYVLAHGTAEDENDPAQRGACEQKELEVTQ
jgi:hypothetical protein